MLRVLSGGKRKKEGKRVGTQRFSASKRQEQKRGGTAILQKGCGTAKAASVASLTWKRMKKAS